MEQNRSGNTMRLFIAINFDNKTKQNMLAVQRRLREWGAGNFSRPENLHLTLAFLGEVAADRVAAVRRAMDRVSVSPMELTFDHVGCFKRDGGDLWWIGIHEIKALAALQSDLARRLTDESFRLESRRFSPHITLAREVRLQAQPDRAALLGSPFMAGADRISLMRSERIQGKLVYTEQYTAAADTAKR